jgi:hypothetical protein
MRSALLSGALGVLLGGGVVWLNGGNGKTGPAESPATERAPGGDGGERLGPSPVFGAITLRAAVHKEAASGSKAAAGAAKVPLPSPSFETARAYVEERLGKGVWTEADRQRMRDLLGDMSDQERMDLLKRVIVAVNKGQVKVELEGPVF